MRQLRLFPDKTTFEEGDRVKFIKKGLNVKMPFGSIGTVKTNSYTLDESIRVKFDNHHFTWHCLIESLEHI